MLATILKSPQAIQAAETLQLQILASGNFELCTLPQAVSLNPAASSLLERYDKNRPL